VMIPDKKRLLIAGGGYSDIPLIQAAKSLGFYVITSGNRPNDLGHRYSDECCLRDFSDEQAMLKLAKSLRIDAICACCNDFSALTASYVAEQMGLPGHDSYETAQIIHHKDRYRRFALEYGIPSPHGEGFESVEAALVALHKFLFPVIIKPVDLTGGKGISVITRTEDAKTALEGAFRLSRVKRVIVEEFIEGSRHGLSTFICDGRLVFYFNDNEHYYLNPYLVSAASTPGNVSSVALEKLCKATEQIVSHLSLKTGIFHIQYILRGDEPVIIEICRRAPGDLYTRFVQLATGVDYPSFIVRAAAGMDCSDLMQKNPTGYFIRQCLMTSRTGHVRGVTFDPSVSENVIDQLMWWEEGERVEDFLTHKFGIVFLQFDSMAKMLLMAENMQNLLHIEWA
jgi:biotin carboxylase